MILVKRLLFIVITIITCSCLLFFGIYGYSVFGKTAAHSAEERAFIAEQYLFLAIVFATLLLLLFAMVLFTSIRLDKQMDKIIELNKFHDFSPERNMEKLGALGGKITTLYQQLNTLNEKKTFKISALSSLVTFLVNNIGLPLLITDIGGTILQASNQISTKLSVNRSELINQKIDEVLTGIQPQNVSYELTKYRSSIEKNTEKYSLTCYPIYNRENNLSYIVYVLEKKALYKPPATENESQSDRAKRNNFIRQTVERFFR